MAKAQKLNLESLSLEQLQSLYLELSNYDEPPVDVEKFMEDPEYLGAFWDEGIYPYWMDFYKDLFPSPFISPYWLVSLRGPIGAGKSVIAAGGIAYGLHKTLCLSSPQGEYGLLPTTQILYAIFSNTVNNSDMIWNYLVQMFQVSPYFRKFVGTMLERKKRSQTLFPKNIDFFRGSRISHALGKAIITGVIDEANFDVVTDQLYKTFNAIKRRMESRFMMPGGGIPGHFWVVSSETDKFSTMNRIIDSHKGSPGVTIKQDPIWEVKPNLLPDGRKRYAGKKFWVFKGSDVRPAQVVGDDSDSLLDSDPENCIQVPVEHKEAFDADVNEALRDIAGVATASKYKLFRHKDKLIARMTVPLLFPDIVQLDFDDDTDQLQDKLLIEGYFHRCLNPHMPRAIHVDNGVTGDRLGIAATYISGFRERSITDQATLQETVERSPETITEFAVGIEPLPGKRIPFFKIRIFILWLRACGYPIHAVTYDGYESEDATQLLTKQGFKTYKVSVDKTSVPYFQFRAATYEGRTSIPKSDLLKRELQELLVSPDGDSVDHPDKNEDKSPGSKDVADAVTGSTFVAHEMRNEIAHIERLLEPQYTNRAADGVVKLMGWDKPRRRAH